MKVFPRYMIWFSVLCLAIFVGCQSEVADEDDEAFVDIVIDSQESATEAGNQESSSSNTEGSSSSSSSSKKKPKKNGVKDLVKAIANFAETWGPDETANESVAGSFGNPTGIAAIGDKLYFLKSYQREIFEITQEGTTFTKSEDPLANLPNGYESASAGNIINPGAFVSGESCLFYGMVLFDTSGGLLPLKDNEDEGEDGVLDLWEDSSILDSNIADYSGVSSSREIDGEIETARGYLAILKIDPETPENVTTLAIIAHNEIAGETPTHATFAYTRPTGGKGHLYIGYGSILYRLANINCDTDTSASQALIVPQKLIESRDNEGALLTGDFPGGEGSALEILKGDEARLGNITGVFALGNYVLVSNNVGNDAQSLKIVEASTTAAATKVAHLAGGENALNEGVDDTRDVLQQDEVNLMSEDGTSFHAAFTNVRGVYANLSGIYIINHNRINKISTKDGNFYVATDLSSRSILDGIRNSLKVTSVKRGWPYSVPSHIIYSDKAFYITDFGYSLVLKLNNLSESPSE